MPVRVRGRECLSAVRHEERTEQGSELLGSREKNNQRLEIQAFYSATFNPGSLNGCFLKFRDRYTSCFFFMMVLNSKFSIIWISSPKTKRWFSEWNACILWRIEDKFHSLTYLGSNSSINTFKLCGLEQVTVSEFQSPSLHHKDSNILPLRVRCVLKEKSVCFRT